MLATQKGRCGALFCCLLLWGCGDIDADTDAIFERAPKGSPFETVPPAMKTLGYECKLERNPFTGPRGDIKSEPYLACVREIPYLWICHRRTRAFAIQLRGRLSDMLVNSGVFCL